MSRQLGLRDEEKDHISQVTLGGQNKLRTWTWIVSFDNGNEVETGDYNYIKPTDILLADEECRRTGS